jgi:hypothetical protein
MSAKEFAQYVFNLMDKAGYPYMSPELNEATDVSPLVIRVWDDRIQMLRTIAFADSAEQARNALNWLQSTSILIDEDLVDYYWPEAWWLPEGQKPAEIIEGWDEG